MLNTVDRKLRMITQAMASPESASRQLEEECEPTYAELMGITTGSELIKEKVELDAKIEELTMEKNGFAHAKGYSRFLAKQQQIMADEKLLRHEKVIETLSQAEPEGDKFKIRVAGKDYTHYKSAGVALHEQLQRMSAYKPTHTVGEYRGFPVQLVRDSEIKSIFVKINAPVPVQVKLIKDVEKMMMRLEDGFKNLEVQRDLLPTEISGIKAYISELEENAEKDFSKQSELSEAIERLAEVEPLVQEQIGEQDDAKYHTADDHPFAQRIGYSKGQKRDSKVESDLLSTEEIKQLKEELSELKIDEAPLNKNNTSTLTPAR